MRTSKYVLISSSQLDKVEVFKNKSQAEAIAYETSLNNGETIHVFKVVSTKTPAVEQAA